MVYTSFLNKSRLFEFLVDIGRPFHLCISLDKSVFVAPTGTEI